MQKCQINYINMVSFYTHWLEEQLYTYEYIQSHVRWSLYPLIALVDPLKNILQFLSISHNAPLTIFITIIPLLLIHHFHSILPKIKFFTTYCFKILDKE